ncbi:MAG: 50S ribosomal protein L22 [Methanocalculus sp. MSAO_Arc1]|uniref:50S ribosomal protein L22 n=1 Tax=Methanocalculus TaxID=71151 RepID=UPI000FEDD859|nr:MULTISPECIES: 50S ribosomal protein L22 [unclassified Methanocalculus]MCP1662983.1 large subunit ribosomal protein L22 [Methanocalculus sp. AMF5]RQD80752.1 MAG: 50S ribosomal protein L22 [Methanocalculus sp. MSAO_Arc1]
MARTDYIMKIEGENIAKAKANELNCSPKHAIEIASFIRHKDVDFAIDYLNDVILKKKAIPFGRFRRKVAHQKTLKGPVCQGRFPVKASKEYVRLLNSVKKNAEYAGLATDNLEIVHAAANRGRSMKGIFPRAMGRATPKARETVTIEVIVREVEE